MLIFSGASEEDLISAQFVLNLHLQRLTVFSGNNVYPADELEQSIDLVDPFSK